jgi:D-alanyl-D-alanine dipeptidase
MNNLVSLEKYGFVIDNSERKDYTKAKKMFVRKSVAKALVKARELLPKGYNFKIFDGKRSIEDQRRIIKICEIDFKNRDPKNWKEMLVKFTGGYQSLKQKLPKNTHRHGGAVDLTIINEKGKELDMGEDTLDKREALNYYERKKNLTKREKQIKKNRKLLKKVMTEAGFEPHFPEWNHWRFSK